MRIMVVHPGASHSTADVYDGMIGALEATEHTIIHYELGDRLYWSGAFLNYVWRKQKKQGIEREKPTTADISYLACSGIIERALRLRADWVLIVCAQYVWLEVIAMLRQTAPRVAVLFTESPYDDEWQLKYAPWVDACWTNERTSVAKFREANPRSYYWQHALDTCKHTPESNGEPVAAHDVVFVGTGFAERVEMLGAVDWTGIDLGLYGPWTLLGSRNKLRQHLRAGPIDNRLTAELYRQAKIGINLHRQSIGWGRDAPRIGYAESMGPRCYELAACGCFFISDYRAEVEEVFGDVVPTFETAQEMEGLIRYYLAHEDERRERAAALPGLVAEHTFENRIAPMVAILENLKET